LGIFKKYGEWEVIMNKSLSIIIPFWDDKETLENVIMSARQLVPLEIIVVVNEGTNETEKIEKKFGCKVIVKDKLLRNDVGRMLGAKEAKGDVLLFLDGDVLIPASNLKKFLQPILAGHADVVLNNLDKLFMTKQPLDSYMVWGQVLNEILDRTDLNIDSILSFPYALTKEVVQGIGYQSFANPILSHMRIIEQKWHISRGDLTDVIPLDKIRPYQYAAQGNKLSDAEKLNLSDHLEALAEWLQKRGVRGGFTDGGKRRDILEQLKKHKNFPYYRKGWGMKSSIYNGKQLSVIIPAQNEEMTIEKVIREARKIEPMEIIVVVNGSNDNTTTIASNLGATVIKYKEPLGHNVGRAIGALAATGDIILFMDADFAIPARDLHPFTQAVADGVDMALNDLDQYLPICFPFHNVAAFKYALNLICHRKDLGIGSLLTVPHAISRSCLESIGFETLVCPSLAQVKAVLQGYKVSCVHSVDVINLNRIRLDQHIGSYIGYTDGGKRQDIIEQIKKHKNFSLYQQQLVRKSSIYKGWGMKSSIYNGEQLSVVIPAQNHEKTIEKVIREARKVEPLEIIVVVNGSTDNTEKIAKQLGATVIVYKEALEHDVARAIGALEAKGDIIHFVDAALKGQTQPQAELRIMGDHLEAISYLIGQLSSGFHDG
jgi:glycosyltransferase involved in cell wall biosynthesis